MAELINENNRLFAFLKKGFFPSMVVFGKLENYFKTLESKNCFVIVSETVYKNYGKTLKSQLRFEDRDIFFQSEEPTLESLKKCKQMATAKQYEFILGFGGGSVMDLAKAVKKETNLKLLLVPTTPGTGSEASPYSVFVDNQKNKTVLSSYMLLPDAVVLDPTLLKSLPKELLGYSAIDILGHSIEALFSKFSNPVSDAIAIASIEMVFNTEKEEKEMLQKMQTAGFLGGLAQGMASTGLAHALSHYFGPKYGIPHSKAVSIFLKDVVELNLENSDAGKKLPKAGQLTKKKLVQGIDRIFKAFGIMESKIEVESFDVKKCVEHVKKDACTLTNPFRPSEEQIEAIIKKHIVEK